MASELSSIPGLGPKHEAVLTGPLRIRTALELARADRRVVHAAMRRMRPAPTLEDIAGWQDHARDLAAAARAESPGPPGPPGPAGQSGWEQVAAFVVSFETRQTTADPERRLVVEQVEQAPPEPRQEWPAWSREAAWTWMLERLEAEQAAPDSPPAQRESPGQDLAAAGQPGPGAESQPESAAHRGRVPGAITASPPELVLAAGTVRRLDAAGPVLHIPPQAVLRITATSAPDLPLQVGLRLRRPDAPSYAPCPAVTAVSGETAEIDLDGLPPGEHAAVLTIWASHGKAAAAVIPLPRLCVPQRS